MAETDAEALGSSERDVQPTKVGEEAMGAALVGAHEGEPGVCRLQFRFRGGMKGGVKKEREETRERCSRGMM